VRAWLFYAGPENYLDAGGERDFAASECVWSCSPDVAVGDVALLYRRALNWSIATMVGAGMLPAVAKTAKVRNIGSDLPVLWQLLSGDVGPLHDWASSCHVRHLATLTPPISLKELKAIPALRRWEDLRWNFRAKGRAAVEIPAFAWEILATRIGERLGRRVEALIGPR
jgi:hypothetical protein